MSFNTITYLSHCHGLRRNTVTWFTLAIKTCLKTVLPRDTLLQITLLRGYIQLNEQPVVFMSYMCCSFAGYWWFYIYRACAETSIGTFITPGKCKRYNVPHFRCYLFATHTLSRETALITLFMTWPSSKYINILYLFIFSQKSSATGDLSTLSKAQKLCGFQDATCWVRTQFCSFDFFSDNTI